MNEKSVLLLSGASAFLLASPAIATATIPTPTPEELIPAPAPTAPEADVQQQNSVVVPVEVAQPERVEEAIAPLATVPISPPESSAPDFSSPVTPTEVALTEAIAPIPPESVLESPESEPVSSEPAPLPKPAAELDEQTQSTASETVPEEVLFEEVLSEEAISEEAVPEAASLTPVEQVEELDELVQSVDQPGQTVQRGNTEAIAPMAEVDEPTNELMEDSAPRLYGESDLTDAMDGIEQLAQDDLEHLTTEEWLDLLLDETTDSSQLNLESQAATSEPSPAAVPHAAENQLATLQGGAITDIKPQEFAPEVTLLSKPFDADREFAPGSSDYRFAVGDRLFLTVKPYGFNLSIPVSRSRSDVSQSSESGLTEADPMFKTPAAVDAEFGIDFRVANRARFQVAYATRTDASELRTSSDQQTFDQQTLEAQSERAADGVRAIAQVNPAAANPAVENGDVHRFVRNKTKETDCSEQSSAYAFNGSLQWRIAPHIIIQTWGGLTIKNPLSTSSSTLSLAYLFYLGFPDPFDQEGDQVVFLVGQPPRLRG